MHPSNRSELRKIRPTFGPSGGSGGMNVEIAPGDPGPSGGRCQIVEEPLEE